MKKLLITTVVLYISCTTPSHALRVPADLVCSATGKPMLFKVSFDADFENGVTITDPNTGKAVMTFNNQYGHGAGGEWRSGAGIWKSPPGCFKIKAAHKNGPANPNLPWVPSQLRRSGYTFGFEDGTDNDFNDAVVSIRR